MADRKRYNVSPEEFVKAWQESKTVQEVADKLQMPRNLVLSRKSMYSKNRKDGSPGVQLKTMAKVSKRTLNIDKLNEIAKGAEETQE